MRPSENIKRKSDHLTTAFWKGRTTYVKRTTITVLQCIRSQCVLLDEEIDEEIAWDTWHRVSLPNVRVNSIFEYKRDSVEIQVFSSIRVCVTFFARTRK